MNSIELIKKGVYRVSFKYDQEIVDSLRKQSKRKYDYNKKCWEVTVKSLTATNQFLELLRDFKWDFINCEKEIIKMIDFVEEKNIQMEENKELSSSKSSLFQVKGLNHYLYPYQSAGVEYMVKNKKVILGDEPGLGKTIESLAAVHYSKAYSSLVICPNTLKLNWKREIEKWIPNIKVVILETGDPIKVVLKQKFDFLICNYHAVTKYYKELKKNKFKSMIIDESHFLKSNKTKRTKAVKVLSKSINIIFELTGTVIANRPNELVSQLNVLGIIDEFGGDWNFLMRYCNGQKNGFGWDFSGSSNILELHEKLRENCYIRREGKDVLTELPDITRSIIDIEITNRREYNKAERDLIEYLKGFKYKEEEIKEWVSSNYKDDWENLSLSDQKLAYKEFREEKVSKASSAEHLVRINVLRQLVSKGKRKSIIEWIENFLENDRKLVLFGYHIREIEEIAEYFKIKPIIGSTSIDDRQKIIDDFQENEETKLIILNTKIGGVGITLTAAHHLAFLSLGWTPGEISQAEKRIHRIGTKFPVNVYCLLGVNTIDEDMYSLIMKKKIVTDMVNKGVADKSKVNFVKELLNNINSRVKNK